MSTQGVSTQKYVRFTTKIFAIIKFKIEDLLCICLQYYEKQQSQSHLKKSSVQYLRSTNHPRRQSCLTFDGQSATRIFGNITLWLATTASQARLTSRSIIRYKKIFGKNISKGTMFFLRQVPTTSVYNSIRSDSHKWVLKVFGPNSRLLKLHSRYSNSQLIFRASTGRRCRRRQFRRPTSPRSRYMDYGEIT